MGFDFLGEGLCFKSNPDEKKSPNLGCLKRPANKIHC